MVPGPPAKKAKLGNAPKIDENEASYYTCKMSTEEKTAAEAELAEIAKEPITDLRGHYLKFRVLFRNVFQDHPVKKLLEDFPWLQNVSFII